MLEVDVAAPLAGFELAVGLTVAAGECVALVGPSGAGKSTTLRAVAGLFRPASGSVTCGDAVWFDAVRGVDVPPEHRRVGYLFQDYALFPHLRAWQNVAFGMRGGTRRDRERGARDLLDAFGLAPLADAHPVTLSGGERQRVALARALATAPSALLLDEPLSALDVQARAAGARVVGGVLRTTPAPTLLVTHDFAEAAALADRVAVVDRGRVIQQGSASALAAAPASRFVAELTGAVVLATPGGEVAVFPWELRLASGPPGGGGEHHGARVVVDSLVRLGSRVLVHVSADGRPLTVETTPDTVAGSGLAAGRPTWVVWDPAVARPVSTAGPQHRPAVLS